MWMKSKNYDIRHCGHFLILWIKTIIGRGSRFKINICSDGNILFKFKIFLQRQQILHVKIVYVTRSTCAVFDMSIKSIFSSVVIRTAITLKSCSVPNFFIFVKRSSIGHVNSGRKKHLIFCVSFLTGL